MKEVDIEPIYHTRDVNMVVNLLTESIAKVLDNQAPVKTYNNRKHFCPYMDNELLTEVRKKKALFKRFKERRKHGLSVN